MIGEKSNVVNLSLQALTEKTAQLPQISLEEAPRAALGKNTADSMRAGVIYGTAAMLDGMIDRICAEQGSTLPVYVTGGVAASVIPHCKHEMTLVPYLVLQGLLILYRKNAQ